MMELVGNNKVSVIIVSAGKSTLENTLFNLRDQFKDKIVQIVLVLDTSHEWNFNRSFFEILTDKYFKVEVVKDCLKSISEGRNKGLAIANGDIILFMDDDVLIDRNFVEHLFKLQTKNASIFVPKYYDYLDSHFGEISKSDTSKVLRRIKSPDCIRIIPDKYSAAVSEVFINRDMKHLRWIGCIGRCLVINRAGLDKCSGFDESFIGWGVEDLEFSYRAFLNGVKIEKMSNICFHVVHSVNDHLKELNRNLFVFESKYPRRLDVHLYRLFTFGIISLQGWQSLEEKEIRDYFRKYSMYGHWKGR